MRRLFDFVCIVSVLAGIVFVIAFAWGKLAPTRYAWARWGFRWDVEIRQDGVNVTRIDQWPRDEPLRQAVPGEANTITFMGNATQRYFRFGQWLSAYPVDVSVAAGPGSQQRFSTSRLPPPLSPRICTEVFLFPGRCLIPALILPAAWLVSRLLPRRRWRPGLCRVCLYDLRGSTERCPECGTSISSGSA
jgi:hypothetical protein